MSDKNTPCMDILNLFTDPSVPERGPFEQEIKPKDWDTDVSEDTSLPGEGMDRFPFLYVGEGHNRIYVVSGGKVVWTYDTGKGGELDDVWMLSNGNILFSRMAWCGEVSPKKEQVWYFPMPEGAECHSLQPVGPDCVLMVLNAPKPLAVIVNKYTGEAVYSHEIPYDPALPVHTQFRRIRLTHDGHFLLPYLEMGKVVEYDKEFNIVWECRSERPWSAFKLRNGNIVITDENEMCVKEVDRDGNTVWMIRATDIPDRFMSSEIFDRPTTSPISAPGATSEPIGWQSCVRLENGNTILCSQGDYGRGAQFIEVTPQKEIVWALKNWKDLGPATSIQILSDPGIPEEPGSCTR